MLTSNWINNWPQKTSGTARLAVRTYKSNQQLASTYVRNEVKSMIIPFEQENNMHIYLT